MSEKLLELKEENKQLAIEISRAELSKDHDEQIRLKRQFYTNKIAFIDLLDARDMKLSVSAFDLMDRVSKMKPTIRYETGMTWLDANLHGGFEVGSLIILGGQSGAGKSHIMLDMLSNISKYARTLFFNFEMGDRRLVSRLHKLLKTDEQKQNFMINTDSRDLDDLVMEIKLQANDGVVFFALDSRMKITVKGSDAEYQKIASITKTLSEVAIRHDIIIFLINQISEDNLKTKTLAFKGSGDQLYDSDMALFLIIEDDDSRTLICKKNRQDEFLWNAKLPGLELQIGYQDKTGRTVATPSYVKEYEPTQIEMSVL